MSEIQQQVADGAQPRARVGDVIAHGEAIPANVVRLRDAEGDLWVLSSVGHWHMTQNADGCNESCPSSKAPGEAYYPYTVVEVDPEPRAAWVGFVHAFVRGKDDCCDAWLATGSPPLTGKVQCGNVQDSPCHLGSSFQPQPDCDHRELLDEMANLLDIGPFDDMAEALRYRLGEGTPTPAAPGPLVLTLPEVPAGAVALIGVESGRRWDPYTGPLADLSPRQWENGSRIRDDAGVLFEEGSVAVELAPPREPRVWEPLDPGTDDLQVVECLGMRYTRGPDSLWYGDRTSRTWLQLRAMGEVREVLT